ncbi:DNA-binding protein [Heyndrickxia oleronia]|uniref:DNA-binding protein n=1 Tax=Heyndrickxia oleronia TaxID=38875 RepID=A0AAW6SW64_9BACI|nr:DNA-binding protein [Heyndrickxia oleronia]MDH5162388.1 DNA-binding protein [Heyndrickxia oleronia]
MEMMWIAIGLIGDVYFIGEGLKNFKIPNVKGLLERLDENDEHELLNEKDIHYFIGISKEDAQALLKEHPSIPHI